jgi:hypothetical protein
MEYFVVVTLFMSMVWVTVSPHHQDKTLTSNNNKEFLKSIHNFIKSRAYHLSATKPIFTCIFVNLVVIDLAFFKLIILKLSLFKTLIRDTPFLSNFFDNYVDTRFIDVLEKVLVTSWQALISGFSH